MGYILLLRAEWHEIAIQPLIIIYHADASMSRAPVSKRVCILLLMGCGCMVNGNLLVEFCLQNRYIVGLTSVPSSMPFRSISL